jgi:hypothetical protein
MSFAQGVQTAALQDEDAVIDANEFGVNINGNNIANISAMEAILNAEPKQPTQPSTSVKNFDKKNLFEVTPIQTADKKAKIKASIATQFIGFGEGITGSSTETYRQQAGSLANTGNYSVNDVIFVSIPGKRGDAEVSKKEQDKTIKEAIKAVEAGATILTDNKGYTDASSYNTGEKRLYDNMKAKGYRYSEITVDNQVIGTWNKPFTQPSTSVKEGVQELFDSNPKLANQVYEALGLVGNLNTLKVQDMKTKVSENLDTIESTSEDLKKYIEIEFAEKNNLTQEQIDVLIEFVNMGKEDINSNPYVDFEDFKSRPDLIKKYNLREKNIKDTETQWARLKYKFPDLTKKQILNIGSIENISSFIARQQKDALLSEIEGESGLPNNMADLELSKVTPQQKQQAQQKFQEYVDATGKKDIEGFKEFVTQPSTSVRTKLFDENDKELKKGSVVEYNGKKYLFWNDNKGKAQLINTDGTKFSGTPNLDKLTVIGAYTTTMYDNTEYIVTDNNNIYSGATGNLVFVNLDGSTKSKKAKIIKAALDSLQGATNVESEATPTTLFDSMSDLERELYEEFATEVESDYSAIENFWDANIQKDTQAKENLRVNNNVLSLEDLIDMYNKGIYTSQEEFIEQIKQCNL